jgi:fructokinase
MIELMQSTCGGIEFGGTKTICATGNADGELFAQVTIPTTTVEETLAAVYDFFAKQGPVTAIGVGAFGPLELRTSSPEYGSIRNTPKEGWANVALKTMLEQHFALPVSIDLDVNCAALGELYFGAAKDIRNFVYFTLGTGIGGALVLDGQPFHGVRHLEMGHMCIPHEPFDNDFHGSCSFHGDCFEGIASGYALQMRYGSNAEDIDDEHIWELEAGYVASAINNIVMTIGPERVVLGGGLTKHQGLLENIRTLTAKTVNGYMELPESYIVHASGEENGVRGAIKLASLQ